MSGLLGCLCGGPAGAVFSLEVRPSQLEELLARRASLCQITHEHDFGGAPVEVGNV